MLSLAQKKCSVKLEVTKVLDVKLDVLVHTSRCTLNESFSQMTWVTGELGTAWPVSTGWVSGLDLSDQVLHTQEGLR